MRAEESREKLGKRVAMLDREMTARTQRLETDLRLEREGGILRPNIRAP